jgi:molecular chaperone DnaK
METPIAGKVPNDGLTKLEVRIDSQNGYWTSGWVPVVNGYFEVKAVLEEGKVCPFFVYMRDESGKPLNPEPNELTIRHGLPLAAPPLPHTISIEVVRPSGAIELDPIFPRNTALPAEKRVMYRAERTLRPGDPGAGITIKLWEGEDLKEPESNEWIGNLQFSSSMIRRPIPENSEIELFIRIDASRLITVDVFVPHLNQHFSKGVYMPEQEQRDEQGTTAKITREIEALADRLAVVKEHIDISQNPGFAATFDILKREVEDLDIEFTSANQQSGYSDFEKARRIVASTRNLRSQIARLEHQIGYDKLLTTRATRAKETLESSKETVEKYGDKIDRYECDMLRKAFEQAAERLDEAGVRKCVQELDKLNIRVLFGQDWWCRQYFEHMDKSDGCFVNQGAARHWVAQGEAAIRDGDGAKLREALNGLWGLMPASAAEDSRRKAMRTTLRS